MSKQKILIGLVGLFILAFVVYQIPYVKMRVDWRIEIAKTYIRGVVDPAGPVPTAMVSPTGQISQVSTATSLPTETPALACDNCETSTPTPTLAPPPASVSLAVPEYELQGINLPPASV